MTAPEMQELLASCTGIFAPIGDRIKQAGKDATIWVYCSSEFMACRYSREQMLAFASAATLAACEVQRIVEIHHAFAHGAVEIRRRK